MRIPLQGLLPVLLLLVYAVPARAEEPAFFRDPVEKPLVTGSETQLVNFERFEAAVDQQEYRETILHGEIIDGDQLNPQRYIARPQRELPFLLRVRSGASYFDNGPADDLSGSKVGGSYAVDGLLPIYRALTFYGSFSGNHFSEGSQYLGTVGLVKAANRRSQHVGEWLGWGVLFDQYTDTRIDDLYDSQLRLNLNMALTGRDTLGLTWYEPIEQDSFIPFIGAPSVPLFSSQAIEGYLSHQFDAATVTASLGYRNEESAMVYGLMASVPLTDNVSFLAQNKYDDLGRWSNWFGVEIRLGRQPSSCSPACASTGYGQDVVRGSQGFTFIAGLIPGVVGGANPDDQQEEWEDYLDSNGPVVNQTPGDFQQELNSPRIPPRLPVIVPKP